MKQYNKFEMKVDGDDNVIMMDGVKLIRVCVMLLKKEEILSSFYLLRVLYIGLV